MYPVSEAFLEAVKQNTRRYYWTGKITTKAGTEYEFGAEDIVKEEFVRTAAQLGIEWDINEVITEADIY